MNKWCVVNDFLSYDNDAFVNNLLLLTKILSLFEKKK